MLKLRYVYTERTSALDKTRAVKFETQLELLVR